MSVGELQADALDEISIAIERLVEADPACAPAPVWAGEDLKAGDVATAPAQPAPLLADAHPKIDVLPEHMHALDVQHIQALPDLRQPLSDLAPARDRVLHVQETSVDDLLPILLDRQLGLGRHRRRPVQAERPAEATGVLLLRAPIEQRAHRLAAAHDARRVDRLQSMRIAIGKY